MKVIFLDIDGVVATRKSYSNHRIFEDITWGISPVPFDKVSVDNLNKITDTLEAKIVVSSTWRCLHRFDELKTILASEGITGEVIGITPDTHHISSRGAEINEWLEAHPGVESFVILDDEVFDIHQKFPKNIVQTSMKAGLTLDKAVQAGRILLGKN